MGYEDKNGTPLGKFIGIIGKWVIHIISWVLILAIIMGFLFGGFITYNLMKAGSLQEGIKNLEVVMEDNGVLRPFKFVIELLKKISTPEGVLEVTQGSQFETTIDKNSVNKNLGVKIESFEPLNKRINVGEITNAERNIKIEAIAEGYVSTLEPGDVFFLCSTDDGEMGEVVGGQKILRVYPEFEEHFLVRCLYDLDLFEINSNRLTTTHILNFGASYEFTTFGYFGAYMLQQEIYDEKRRNGDEIFEDDVNDKNLNKEKRTVKSIYTYGPMKITMGSSSQPYTESGPSGSGGGYVLVLEIEKDRNWNGNLERIEEFDLMIPNEISLISDNFEYSEEENSYNLYKATDQFLESINGQGKNKKIIASVEFSINNPPSKIDKALIISKLRYVFNEKKSTTITFENEK